VIDASALRRVLTVLTGWLDRQERQAVAYLMEENRVLRRQLSGHRLQFTDDDRSCRPLDDCPDSQEARLTAGAGAPNVVADISPSALGRDSRSRFL
jgi:hypothetical protein